MNIICKPFSFQFDNVNIFYLNLYRLFLQLFCAYLCNEPSVWWWTRPNVTTFIEIIFMYRTCNWKIAYFKLNQTGVLKEGTPKMKAELIYFVLKSCHTGLLSFYNCEEEKRLQTPIWTLKGVKIRFRFRRPIEKCALNFSCFRFDFK